jgi:hypothetical protein
VSRTTFYRGERRVRREILRILLRDLGGLCG